jgi:hypothetical protein
MKEVIDDRTALSVLQRIKYIDVKVIASIRQNRSVSVQSSEQMTYAITSSPSIKTGAYTPSTNLK